jgi:hypothetical protein
LWKPVVVVAAAAAAAAVVVGGGEGGRAVLVLYVYDCLFAGAREKENKPGVCSLAGERERGECAFRMLCVLRILRFFFSGEEGVSACRWWLKAH